MYIAVYFIDKFLPERLPKNYQDLLKLFIATA